MNKINTSPNQNTIFIIAAAMMLFCFSSCARRAFFQVSSVVPAAEGAVKVTRDKHKNYKINISLYNLAEPTRLQPPKSIYVVWMDTESNGTMNIGQINSSGSLFSNQLKADFETVSSFKPVKIFITAENDARIQHPGMQVVLSTNNF